jgi:hypothetical protein
LLPSLLQGSNLFASDTEHWRKRDVDDRSKLSQIVVAVNVILDTNAKASVKPSASMVDSTTTHHGFKGANVPDGHIPSTQFGLGNDPRLSPLQEQHACYDEKRGTYVHPVFAQPRVDL